MNINNDSLIDANIQYQNILNMNIPFTNENPNIKNLIKESENQNKIFLEYKSNKRRTKNEKKERTFICKICNKSYLSYPSLYTHCKKKHNSKIITDRGRGRPKKKIVHYLKERLIYNPINTSYFLKEERNGITEIYDFENCIKGAFNIIYNSNNKEIKERNIKKKMNDYQKVYEHPFLGKFILSKHDRNIKNNNENEVSDIVFMHYLNKMSLYVNPNYFIKLIVFVTLFREFINISNRKDSNYDNENNYYIQFINYKIEPEYTTYKSAEEIPNFSNDFINNFLECDNNLFNFNKIESIDLTQNLCYWMYDNNFTTLKLSLISV